MASAFEERTAPPGAERWFYAPRNPDIPAPTNRDVLATERGPGGDGVSAYRGVGLPPAPDSLVARGGLFMYEIGMLFLPFAPAEAESWLESMRTPVEMTIGAVAGMFLPLSGTFLEAARDALISEVLFGKQEQEKAERALAARWEHPGLFVVPTVDVIEAASTNVRGRGLFAKRTGYLAVTTQGADGREVSNTFGFATSCETFPAALFAGRMRREVFFYTRRAARKLTDYDDRARAGLAKLGLDVTAPEVTLESVLVAVVRAGEAGHPCHATVGQVRDTLSEAGDAAWNEAKRRLGGRLTQEMSRLIVADLEPMLRLYRRVPAMAHQIEIAERVAAGETNRDWTPAWRPEDYHFNFSPGEYPTQAIK